MFTLTTPAKTFTAADLDDLEKQLMLAQSFGTYPMWDYEEDDEWGDEWRRFDGRIWEDSDDPKAEIEDILDYAAWSLNTPREGVTLIEN